MTLDEVLGGRLAVWGMGAEGSAVVALARARGLDPLLIDDHPERLGTPPGGGGAAGPVVLPSEVPWSDIDVVVRAPGVSRYRPELAVAEAAGVTVTTGMAIWLDDYRDAPVLAVTGTKGKSTTASLAAAVLRAGGLDVELLGNIGVPVLDTYGRGPADAYVVEVSSYQAADVTTSPGVVVLTSLAPDHLDWHGGIEQYYRDKLRLVTAGPAPALAVSAGNPEALRRTAGLPNRTLYGPDGRVVVSADGHIEADGCVLADVADLRAPGRHNAWNLCGALAGCLLLTGSVPAPAAVADALSGFDGLPSRCRTVGERDGRTYVDDALASNPFASAASVETFADRPLTVIVGGADRGVDPAPLALALSAHRPPPTVVVLAPDGGRVAAMLTGETGPSSRTGQTVVLMADGLADAVAQAVAHTPQGGVVLFSPGAPTPDGGGGYRERSRQFIEAAGFGHPDH